MKSKLRTFNIYLIHLFLTCFASINVQLINKIFLYKRCVHDNSEDMYAYPYAYV